MEITEKELDEFRKDFNKAMLELQDKYDVTISLGSITYEEERFSARVTVKNGQDPEEIARQILMLLCISMHIWDLDRECIREFLSEITVKGLQL